MVAVRVYPTAEEARQNAALCAILFLEGAITYNERPYVLLRQSASPHFHLGGIGIVPTRNQALQMLDSKDDHLSKQQVQCRQPLPYETLYLLIERKRDFGMARIPLHFPFPDDAFQVMTLGQPSSGDAALLVCPEQ